MLRYYLWRRAMALLHRPWPHPKVNGKYNALQRGAYFTMPLAGALVVLSGWAMHKPSQFGGLERLFGGYDGARVVHFACMLALAAFVVPQRYAGRRRTAGTRSAPWLWAGRCARKDDRHE